MSKACDNCCLEPELVSLNGKRVLAVDDNADHLDLITFILAGSVGSLGMQGCDRTKKTKPSKVFGNQ